MKRRITIAFILIAVAAVFSTGTLAYFTAENKTRNAVTSGKVDFTIHEKTSEGKDFPSEGVRVMPGDTVSKIVTVENTGNAPMYLRVKLTKGVNDESLSAQDCLNIDINEKDWTLKDGYYYYNRAVGVGQTTEALFTEVNFDGESMDNAYRGKVFDLDIDASAVQTANNGETVFDAVGWPAA